MSCLVAAPQVSIVIVTYNSSRDIVACLQSVIAQQGIHSEIIIIDNNSNDGTIKVISDFLMQLPKQTGRKIPNITISQNHHNIGFARAVNQAAAFARSDYIYFLNPDAKLLSATDLAALLNHFKSNAQLGLLGSKVVDSNGVESKPQCQYPNESYVGFDVSKLPGKLAWVIGASMLIPRKLFLELNGLDEDFFLYMEDVDLCLRIRQKGFEIGYCPEVVIEHIGSASADQLPSYNKKILKTKARYLFCQKHYDQLGVKKLLIRDKRRAEKRCKIAKIFGFVISGLKKKLPGYQAVRDVADELLANYS